MSSGLELNLSDEQQNVRAARRAEGPGSEEGRCCGELI